MLHINSRILEIMRHRRASGQTPSVADEKTETQGEVTCSQLAIKIKVESEQGLGYLAILPGIFYLAMQGGQIALFS